MAGGLLLPAVSVWMVLSWLGVADSIAYENGWWQAPAKACIIPTALRGPMVLALACSYHLRRRPSRGREVPAG
ncbi:hypothetical protein [Nonomuraea sp. NPDC049646]|uniref:hypothetical protein n=1 Tax=unclassified Nonomuraea TaxID=2593643 RepID=UPI0037940EF5